VSAGFAPQASGGPRVGGGRLRAACGRRGRFGYTPARFEFRRPDLLGAAQAAGNPLLDSDIFDPYERLVRIEVLGREVEVPERNRLLRCFQFLSLESISMGDFCWNGDCTNCQFWYRDAGEREGSERTALACRFDVREGMTVTRLSPYVHIDGVTNRGGATEETVETRAAAEDAAGRGA
jgi:hypothetical protein